MAIRTAVHEFGVLLAVGHVQLDMKTTRDVLTLENLLPLVCGLKYGKVRGEIRWSICNPTRFPIIFNQHQRLRSRCFPRLCNSSGGRQCGKE